MKRCIHLTRLWENLSPNRDDGEQFMEKPLATAASAVLMRNLRLEPCIGFFYAADAKHENVTLRVFRRRKANEV
jgi:hypothetical protein